MSNIILLTDSYKVSHYLQYPPNTQKVYSYFESRGGQFDRIIFFGLQYYLKEYLQGQVITREKIDEASEIFQQHFATNLFNRAGWEHILKVHEGKLPVVIKAVPEGSKIPTKNVLMTIENTDPTCYWLPNYLETLLVQVWYGCTVASQSKSMKNIILQYLQKTGDPKAIDFKLHDFGFRGVSSVESASIGSAAHLINFKGTDTLAGITFARKYYNAKMPGFSIPASEHSTITSWGKEGELDAYRNMLDKYPTGTIACVSDSYDIYNACKNLWGKELKDKVLSRDGVLVIRPDSGYPEEIVVLVLDMLGERFGYTKEKGYKVLNPKVRVIQGDGIDITTLKSVLSNMERYNWSADNIAFGSGGGLLQKLNRDTCKFAFKCSSAIIDGKERDVFKQPVTDQGKKSKAGRLKLVERNGNHATIAENQSGQDLLQEVFRDGEIKKEYNFQEVIDRANHE